MLQFFYICITSASYSLFGYGNKTFFTYFVEDHTSLVIERIHPVAKVSCPHVFELIETVSESSHCVVMFQFGVLDTFY